MQSELEKETVEEKENGVRAVVNGKLEIVKIELNPAISKEEQEEALKKCLNGAMRKIQMSIAQKMQSMR